MKDKLTGWVGMGIVVVLAFAYLAYKMVTGQAWSTWSEQFLSQFEGVIFMKDKLTGWRGMAIVVVLVFAYLGYKMATGQAWSTHRHQLRKKGGFAQCIDGWFHDRANRRNLFLQTIVERRWKNGDCRMRDSACSRGDCRRQNRCKDESESR
jgi:hypothetical protein